MRLYRDNFIFGMGVTDPLEVTFFETQNLGNTDIPEQLLRMNILNSDESRFMKQIIDGELDEIDKWYFQEIIQKVIGNRNTCRWLCKKPEDVFEQYIAPMNNDLQYEDWLNSDTHDLAEYYIPDNALVLSDLGKEGTLYCYRQNEESYTRF